MGRRVSDLERGIVLACQALVELHDQETMAFDILRETGAGDIDPRRVDVRDRPILRAYRKYAKRMKNNG